jgi:DNA (cytosine-5)-methyltransferase 1
VVTSETALRLFSVCSGTAMLDEGLHTAMHVHGLRSQVVGYCERETYTANLLVDRMEAQALEPAPVFAGDLGDIDWAQWVGRIDGFVGGIPCQPFSQAGQRKGTADKRWLWPTLWEAMRRVGAWFLALENVAAFTAAGLEPLLGDLAENGWVAEWGCLRASDVGAPHQRNRWFLVAFDATHGTGWLDTDRRLANTSGITASEQRGTGSGRRAKRKGQAVAERSSENVADRVSDRLQGQQQARSTTRYVVRGSRADLAYSDEHRRERLKAGRCSAREQPRSDAHGRGIFPPGPADRKTWGKVAPSSQPALCRMADGLAFGLDKSRRDRLRACGNGVVPLQAAVAYAELLERLKA